jgi:flagellin-like protein
MFPTLNCLRAEVETLRKATLRSRKGVSPILATLLLVVIAVAAIAVTYALMITYTGPRAGITLYFSNDKFYENGTKIDIDIGNSGTSDATIIQCYIGTSSSSMSNQTISPLLVPSASVQRLTVHYSWQVGVTYHFKVVASTGQYLQWIDTPNES